MISGVIFDMDGVLVDSHPCHRRAWRELFRSLGKPVADAELDFILEGARREEILRHFLGDLPQAKVIEYGHRKDVLFRNSGAGARPVAGVLPFIEDLHARGVALAVATSASASRTGWTLAQLNLGRYFSAVITGSDVAVGKPDPTIYRLAAARLSLPPQNALACEDAVSGIQAAKQAGIKCLGIAPDGRAELLRQAGAGHVVPNFSAVSFDVLEQTLL